MAGYSGTPLVKKLGIKAGQRVALLNAPPDFGQTLGALPDDITLHSAVRGKGAFDVIVLFAADRARLEQGLAALPKRLTPAGALWIAWPKKASGVATDLTDNVVRNMGLETGLVDNKVCAVDDTWSGLRFVIRLRDRPSGNKRT
jgi:hypothetical protein